MEINRGSLVNVKPLGGSSIGLGININYVTSKPNSSENTSKYYKTLLNNSFRKHKLNNVNKIKQPKSGKPQQYWKLLNGKKPNTVNANLEDLFNFFKDKNFTEMLKTQKHPLIIL